MFSLPQAVHLQTGDDAKSSLVVLLRGASGERAEPSGPAPHSSQQLLREEALAAPGRGLWGPRLPAHSRSGRPCVMPTRPPRATSPSVYEQLPLRTLGEGFAPVCSRALLKGAAPCGTTELGPPAPTHSFLRANYWFLFCFVSRDEFVSFLFVRR